MQGRTANGPLYAPHQARGRFWNPWRPATARRRDLLRWQLERNPYDKRTPPQVPVVRNDGAYLGDPGAPDSITWVGHSTFAIQDGGDVVITDPHWGPRALLPRRHLPPGIPIGAVPRQAFAVLSHNHYDHLDAWTVARLPSAVDWYVPLGLAGWLRRHRRRGEAAMAVRELDWWQSVRRGRWNLTCLPAQHWSNRLDSGRNSTLWCSWLLDSGRRRYYFAGDSGYFSGFAEIGRRFGPIDVALLPIGAYEPRWFMAYPHMNPQDAWQAFLDLDARWLVPMHWGTFDLTDEPIDLPPRVLAEAVAAAHGDAARVRLAAIGERWLLPPAQDRQAVMHDAEAAVATPEGSIH
ncbi:MAG: MBL fold metallo-hydrolase [Acidobacteria bacterium]|nr:MBL fold metallo-hydrolase [Acidobacteriota bacterium]